MTISLQNVVKRYSDFPGVFKLIKREKAVTVFRGLNLDIHAGEIVGIFGSNGSGKTTLLKLIASCCFPTTGKVLIKGLDTCRDNRATRILVAYNSNNARSFFWKLTARENIDLLAAMNGISLDVGYRRTLENLAERLQFVSFLDRPTGAFSRGMMEKMGYLVGFLLNKKILVYDDFGCNLDRQSFDNLLGYLKESGKGQPDRTIIISSSSQEGFSGFLTKKYLIEDQGVRGE